MMMQGKKNDSGKLRFDLMPVRPLESVADVFTRGAAKYEDRNWEKGLKWGRVFAAMMRHAWKWWRGEQLDEEDGQHHLASVAWCALVLMEYERTHPELDDRATPPMAPSPYRPGSLLHLLSSPGICQDYEQAANSAIGAAYPRC
jgi:hypothetical protein